MISPNEMFSMVNSCTCYHGIMESRLTHAMKDMAKKSDSLAKKYGNDMSLWPLLVKADATISNQIKICTDVLRENKWEVISAFQDGEFLCFFIRPADGREWKYIRETPEIPDTLKLKKGLTEFISSFGQPSGEIPSEETIKNIFGAVSLFLNAIPAPEEKKKEDVQEAIQSINEIVSSFLNEKRAATK